MVGADAEGHREFGRILHLGDWTLRSSKLIISRHGTRSRVAQANGTRLQWIGLIEAHCLKMFDFSTFGRGMLELFIQSRLISSHSRTSRAV